MITPYDGVAFTAASDGDMRGDPTARQRASRLLGVTSDWATVNQVHGTRVVEATGPGSLGDADALFTARVGLPLAVFTADCAGVVIHADGGVGVAHAGWRGVDGGVVPGLIEAMRGAGLEPARVAMGPSIGPCCFEVGAEVAERFPGLGASTEWGTTSVDLWSALREQIGGLPLVEMRHCTRHDQDAFSHRRNGTSERMAAIGWLTE